MDAPIPIVLVPAMICTARMYAAQIPELWHCGPVMVAVHRRHSTMAEIAASILAQAPKQFALAGLSMGGYIAFEIVRQAPERVLKLALLATSARPDSPGQSKVRKEQIDIARAGGYGKVARTALPWLLHRKDNEAVRATVLQMAEETGAEAFIRQLEAIIERKDSRPLLAKIACPTLVLVGANDQLLPPENSQEIAAGIRNAHYVEINDCGHAATLEQPEAVTKALVDWLTQ